MTVHADAAEDPKEDSVENYTEDLKKVVAPIRKDNFVTARKILRNVCADMRQIRQS